jgi:hypothetical protein
VTYFLGRIFWGVEMNYNQHPSKASVSLRSMDFPRVYYGVHAQARLKIEINAGVNNHHGEWVNQKVTIHRKAPSWPVTDPN